MKNWLFLRGEYDKNNAENLKNDTDMWCQLFAELIGNDRGYIWFLDKKHPFDWIPYADSGVAVSPVKDIVEGTKGPTHLFARGGFDYYDPIVKKCKNAYKIYYGAGERFLPKKHHYDLILVDTQEQKKKGEKKFPKSKVALWIKPAARHFKPVECKKKYDVCFVADCHSKYQEDFKRVKWVYDTVPKNLKVLHLGQSSIKPPKNVTVKKVPRLKMPEMISQCNVGIVPYKSKDSAPRVIPEMMACGLPVVCLDSVNINIYCYRGFITEKKHFWDCIERTNDPLWQKLVVEYYNTNMSLIPAIKYLKGLIND